MKATGTRGRRHEGVSSAAGVAVPQAAPSLGPRRSRELQRNGLGGARRRELYFIMVRN